MKTIAAIKQMIKQKKWRRQNRHNMTWIDMDTRIECIHVGKATYGPIRVFSDAPGFDLYIGNYCSIAHGVTFLLSVDHVLNHLSSYPFRKKVIDSNLVDATSKGSIIVSDDVWIGYGATILSGVTIGQGAVIGAGAVVSKDVEPYSIVGGVPSKMIKKRFSDEVIDFMLTLDYSKLDDNIITGHINDLYKGLENLSRDEVKEYYDWFPKKSNE